MTGKQTDLGGDIPQKETCPESVCLCTKMQKKMNRRPKNDSRARGQSLVEFALALPLMILILAGVVDLGRAFYAYVGITNAAREGARFAATAPNNASGIRARVRKELENSNLSIADDSQIPSPTCNSYVDGSTSLGGSVSCASAANGDYVTVTVTYPFSFITGYIAGLSSITLSRAATMSISK